MPSLLSRICDSHDECFIFRGWGSFLGTWAKKQPQMHTKVSATGTRVLFFLTGFFRLASSSFVQFGATSGRQRSRVCPAHYSLAPGLRHFGKSLVQLGAVCLLEAMGLRGQESCFVCGPGTPLPLPDEPCCQSPGDRQSDACVLLCTLRIF